MPDQPKTIDVGSGAGELIAAGVQLMQIRTEKQIAISAQRPRKEADVAKALYSEAETAGEDFFYRWVPKKHLSSCNRRGKCECPEDKPIQGPGVGLVRSAVRLWGNCSVEVQPESEGPDHWMVRAWFVDFQTNFTRSEVKRVSKMIPKGGGGYRVAGGKELDLVYQQGASKVERDAVHRGLPKWLIDRAFEIALTSAFADTKPFREKAARIVARYSQLGVTLSMIETHLGHKFEEAEMLGLGKNPKEVCAYLTGVGTAIVNEEATVEEIFGQQGPSASATGAANPSIKVEDLTANGRVEERPEPKPANGLFPEKEVKVPEPAAEPTITPTAKPAGSTNGTRARNARRAW
jgi:hypothetical protein